MLPPLGHSNLQTAILPPPELLRSGLLIYAGGECKQRDPNAKFGGGQDFDEVEGYDPKTNTWRPLARLPSGYGARRQGQRLGPRWSGPSSQRYMPYNASLAPLKNRPSREYKHGHPMIGNASCHVLQGKLGGAHQRADELWLTSLKV
jgi:hypothetical protein